MDDATVAIGGAIVAAVCFAAVATITFRSLAGRLTAYCSCLILAVAPLFRERAVYVLAVAALVMAMAVIVGRRRMDRQ